MTTQEHQSRDANTSPAVRSIALGVGLAGLWVVLGFWRPETTYHLAPLLVGAVPVGFAAGTVDRASSFRLGAFGLGLALAASLVLAAIPGFDGPTIGPFGSAGQETVVLAFVGSIGATLYATLTPPSDV